MEPQLDQLFGLSEQAWLSIDQVATLLGMLTSILAPAALLLGALNRDRLRAWLTRNRFPQVGQHPAPDARWDAIVFTVSRREVPCWVLETLKPKLIGLVVTAASRAAGEEIAKSAEDLGIHVLPLEEMADPDDPAEAQIKTRRLLEDVAARGMERVGVDVTGGKVPMSLGAFMAAEEALADTLYVTVEYDKSTPRMNTAKVLPIRQPR